MKNESRKVWWISRHSLTEAQEALLRRHFDVEEIEQKPLIFSKDEFPSLTLLREGIYRSDLVAIVAPSWVVVSLVLDGWELLEFVNSPSSRIRGKFLCEGAFLMNKLEGARFLRCPLSLEEQEEVDLTPTERK